EFGARELRIEQNLTRPAPNRAEHELRVGGAGGASVELGHSEMTDVMNRDDERESRQNGHVVVRTPEQVGAPWGSEWNLELLAHSVDVTRARGDGGSSIRLPIRKRSWRGEKCETPARARRHDAWDDISNVRADAGVAEHPDIDHDLQFRHQ